MKPKLYGVLNDVQRDHLLAALKERPFLEPLAAKLMSLGGDVPVVWNPDMTTSEHFIPVLLHMGRVSNGRLARMRFMEPNRCHDNAVRLAMKWPHKYQREIGFALSGGIWAPHSWAFDIGKNQIVETTSDRERYFGVTMVINESEKKEAMAA